MVGSDETSDICLRRKFISTVGGLALTSAAGCLGITGDSGREINDSQNSNGDGIEATEEPDIRRVGLGADTFEHLSDLETVGGKLSADTERHITGTQCAALDTGADGAWLHIPLSEPLDFSNARPACYLATDGTAAGKYLYLDLRDGDGNRFRTRTVVRGHEELIRVDFGIINPQVDDEAVDLENITQVSFRPGPRSESGTETVYLDYPSRIKAPDTPKFVFQFDDGGETDYTQGFSYLSQFDYPAITYVNTDTIGSNNYLNEKQLQELKAEGWLIGSHTTDHTNLTELSDSDEIERKVRDAKQWLVEREFTEGARHFAYPYNGIDEQALSVVSRYHDTGRVAGWQPVALPSNLQLIQGDGDPTLSEIQTLLDWATRYGGVVVVYYHSLRAEKDIEEFRAVVDEVHRRERASDVEVIRLDELYSLTKNMT
ncbi:MAG: polysaccharide deacetylase family protein [Natronomonas sp.]